jgi:hypothetical protein
MRQSLNSSRGTNLRCLPVSCNTAIALLEVGKHVDRMACDAVPRILNYVNNSFRYQQINRPKSPINAVFLVTQAFAKVFLFLIRGFERTSPMARPPIHKEPDGRTDRPSQGKPSESSAARTPTVERRVEPRYTFGATC